MTEAIDENDNEFSEEELKNSKALDAVEIKSETEIEPYHMEYSDEETDVDGVEEEVDRDFERGPVVLFFFLVLWKFLTGR